MPFTPADKQEVWTPDTHPIHWWFWITTQLHEFGVRNVPLYLFNIALISDQILPIFHEQNCCPAELCLGSTTSNRQSSCVAKAQILCSNQRSSEIRVSRPSVDPFLWSSAPKHPTASVQSTNESLWAVPLKLLDTNSLLISLKLDLHERKMTFQVEDFKDGQVNEWPPDVAY